MNRLRALLAAVAATLTLTPAPAQTVFVTDFYNATILRVNSVTGTPVAPPVANTPLPPSALVYGSDGNLYTANQNPSLGGGQGSISKINPVTGSLISTINFSTSVNPGGLAFAPNGDIFVTNFSDPLSSGGGSVQRFSISGTTATLVSTLATNLTQPTGIFLNGTDLYFTETNSADYYTGTSNFQGGRLSRIQNATTSPSAAQVLVNGPRFTGFGGMALSGSTLYYTDLLAGALDRYDVGTNTALGALIAPGGSLNVQFPSGLYIDSPGSILVANLGAHNPTGPGDPGTGNLRRYSTLTPDTQIGGDIVSNIYAGVVINAVPEPGTLALTGGAVALLAAWRRKSKLR